MSYASAPACQKGRFHMIRDECDQAAALNERDARDLRWSRMMAAAQAGDARAHEALLCECLPLPRAVCRARLRDATEADDAVQDTLLTVHRARGQLQCRTSLSFLTGRHRRAACAGPGSLTRAQGPLRAAGGRGGRNRFGRACRGGRAGRPACCGKPATGDRGPPAGAANGTRTDEDPGADAGRSQPAFRHERGRAQGGHPSRVACIAATLRRGRVTRPCTAKT